MNFGFDDVDLEEIRDDFPVLQQKVHGKPLIYFDNAATSQKPRVVIQALNDCYEAAITQTRPSPGIHAVAEPAQHRNTRALPRIAGSSTPHLASPSFFTRGLHRVHQPRRLLLGTDQSPRGAMRDSPARSTGAPQQPAHCLPVPRVTLTWLCRGHQAHGELNPAGTLRLTCDAGDLDKLITGHARNWWLSCNSLMFLLDQPGSTN